MSERIGMTGGMYDMGKEPNNGRVQRPKVTLGNVFDNDVPVASHDRSNSIHYSSVERRLR